MRVVVILPTWRRARLLSRHLIERFGAVDTVICARSSDGGNAREVTLTFDAPSEHALGYAHGYAAALDDGPR